MSDATLLQTSKERDAAVIAAQGVDRMRHATYLAIARLSGQYPHVDVWAWNVRACDWTTAWDNDAFDAGAAELLLGGTFLPPILPTCPTCAVLVDAALEYR